MGTRILQMIVLAFAFWIVAWVLCVTTVVQLVVRLVGGRANDDLSRFGGALARYAAQVIAFLTFADDAVPFPFRDWPAAPGSRD
ncbi:MAG: hypothetical protein NAOJABEB_01401 [Steroidobacteraceae bacterium]|nr:hypothetical protein [Steroidobacteraceae bacterium]